MKPLPEPFEALSMDAKAVAAAYFVLMGKAGRLTFRMNEYRPTLRTKEALEELVTAGIILREEGCSHLPRGAVEYRPLVDCHPLLGWFFSLPEDVKETVNWPLVEPIT